MGGKTRPPYHAEYRAWIMELARAGRNPEELAMEFTFRANHQKLAAAG